ncbi:hypothetical protein ACFYP4_15890 [Streptomyces sp. NPDC005551]|uniref:hypothetical protein n=1 Tax=Streptomyces sp. NPDC005551 TaxID=3364725 RepID=UPI0036C4C851
MTATHSEVMSMAMAGSCDEADDDKADGDKADEAEWCGVEDEGEWGDDACMTTPPGPARAVIGAWPVTTPSRAPAWDAVRGAE